MHYREHTTIAIIRDNGERSSLRLPRRLFLALVVFFLLLLPLCGLAVWQAVSLWVENSALKARNERVASELGEALATAQRLQDLETLLNEERIEGREYILRNLAAREADTARKTAMPAAPAASKPDPKEGAEPDRDSTPQANDDGGDGEAFQGVNLGYVRVGNVTARLDRQRRQRVLRIALDLHNTDKQDVASGTVEAILLTADGERTSLEYTVEDAGHFRISFFKRAVMLSRLPAHHNLTNAQVLLEIRNHEHTLVYSNLYPVVQ